MRIKKPKYVVCPRGQKYEFFKTKKEITEEYGFTYEQIEELFKEIEK